MTCEMTKGEDLEMPLVHLKDKASKSEVVFAQVHLKAKSGTNTFDDQRIQ